ncbi:MAG: YihY/virulence factor BrkB family protein [Kofleriaceae bacterium]
MRTLHRWRARLPKLTFLRRLINGIVEHDVPDLGAMMAYYAVLSLFPMLVFIVTVALLVIDPATIHEGVLIATRTLPESARGLISEQVTNFINAAGAGFAIGSLAFALWGASRGAASLGGALDRITRHPETRPWWKRQLTAIAVTVGVALLIVAALGLLVLGPPLGHYVADRFGLGGAFDMVWEIGRWVGAGLLVLFVWAVAYHFLPDTDAPFRMFTTGGLVGIAMWIAISLGFNFYLTRFGSYETTYGTLGGAIVFLTWLWLSNIALLVGAEINDVLATMRKEKAEAFLADETVRSLDAQADGPRSDT